MIPVVKATRQLMRVSATALALAVAWPQASAADEPPPGSRVVATGISGIATSQSRKSAARQRSFHKEGADLDAYVRDYNACLAEVRSKLSRSDFVRPVAEIKLYPCMAGRGWSPGPTPP